jgi:cysteinylglycine-S-conjugate dipeptidase
MNDPTAAGTTQAPTGTGAATEPGGWPADAADRTAGLDAAASAVKDVMPALLEDLDRLVAIPSVAFPGFPSEPVRRMADAVVELFRSAGAASCDLLDIPDGYPAVVADFPGPPGSPTVLLYAHYDVQPAPVEGWETDPWTATTKADGRIYGRGAADDKSGLVIHAGTLLALAGRLPVTVRVLVEGEEETISHLEAYVDDHPEAVAADVFVIADMGGVRVGEPALTTALRGEVAAAVAVRTLASPVHSGLFGGPVPDALVALIRMLATLHDDDGDTAVAGLTTGDWPEADFDEAVLRETSGLLDGVDLVGSGSLGSRLWSHPSATVIGIDAPTVREAGNVLIPVATAKVSLRIAPGADAEAELDLLVEHLRRAAPWNVEVDVVKVKCGAPFAIPMGGPAVSAAERALTEAYGRAPSRLGAGGSIPLVASLAAASPGAEIVLWGAEDMAGARIHSANESVDPAEIERMVLAQVRLLQHLGSSRATG